MLRLIVIAVLIASGAACSRTEFAYRNADWLLEYYAWKTTHASDTQLDQWQPVLQTTLTRHREQVLPLVITYLGQVEHFIREPETSPGAPCLVDGALLLYQRHARLAVDLAVPLLAGLEAGQIRQLADYTNQRQQDAIEEYLNPDPQRRDEARRERITERIEKWTGDLDQGQRTLVSDTLARIPDMSQSWLTYRAERTSELIDLLEAGAGSVSLRTYLEGWWVYRHGTGAGTKVQWRTARNETVRLINELIITLTGRQRERLERRLADVRQDLAVFVTTASTPVDLRSTTVCAVMSQ